MSKRAGTVVTHRRPGRRDRRRRRALRAGALLARDSTIDIDLDLWAKASPATTRSTTCSTPTPGSARSCATPPTSASTGRRTTSTRRCSSHEREGELLRALAEFPRVVAAAAELREPHRVARYLEDTAGDLPPVLRQLPGAAAGRRGADRPAPGPAAAGRRHPDRARQRPRPARRLRARADVTCAPTRPAGLHADGAPARARPGCARPPTPTRWSRTLWSRDRAQGRRRAASSAGVRAAPTWPPRRHAGVRPRRGRLPGPGPRLPRRVRRRTTSTTPARRSSARRSRRWIAEEGLSLDVCSGGELTVALRAGFDPARIGYHGNNKTVRRAAPGGRRGVGRIIVDSFDEIERLAEVAADARRDRAR